MFSVFDAIFMEYMLKYKKNVLDTSNTFSMRYQASSDIKSFKSYGCAQKSVTHAHTHSLTEGATHEHAAYYYIDGQRFMTPTENEGAYTTPPLQSAKHGWGDTVLFLYIYYMFFFL